MNADNAAPKEHAARYHAQRLLLTCAIAAPVLAGLTAALWLASFFFAASHHLNPLHAGLRAWPDAVLAWREARLPQDGRRLVGTALLGLVLAFGAPALGIYALCERSSARRLYGSARFATEAEIRRAGLL
jgi:hypothetical protein